MSQSPQPCISQSVIQGRSAIHTEGSFLISGANPYESTLIELYDPLSLESVPSVAQGPDGKPSDIDRDPQAWLQSPEISSTRSVDEQKATGWDLSG